MPLLEFDQMPSLPSNQSKLPASAEPEESSPRRLAIISTVILLGILAVMTILEIRSFLNYTLMDFGVYYDAAMALRTGEDMFGVYNQPPLTYIYPPLLAVLFIPFTYLPIEYAAVIWMLANLLLLLACLWLGARILLDRFQARLDVATMPVLLLLTVLYFYPRIDAEFDQGQVDFLVLLGIIGGLCLVNRYPFLAGVLLGIVANIKYQTVIFLPYFLIRGWWSSAVGLVSGAVAAALSGALVIGWATNIDYVKRAFSSLGGMFGLPESDGPKPYIFPIEWSESMSLTSTFARWTNAQVDGTSMTFVFVAIAAAICALVGWGLYASSGVPLFSGRGGRRGRTSPDQQPLIIIEWVGLMVAAIAFAPQTKMRHLALLLPLVMLAVQLLIVSRPGVRRLPLLVVMILTFLALTMPPQATEGLHDFRKWMRAQGVPMFWLLVLYFTVLWTSLRFRAQGSAAGTR